MNHNNRDFRLYFVRRFRYNNKLVSWHRVFRENQMQHEKHGAGLALLPLQSKPKPKQPNGPYHLPRMIQNQPKAPSHVPAIAGVPPHVNPKEPPVRPAREQHEQAMIEGEHILVNAALIQQLQPHDIAHNRFDDQKHQTSSSLLTKKRFSFKVALGWP